jgi:hypothetical protein
MQGVPHIFLMSHNTDDELENISVLPSRVLIPYPESLENKVLVRDRVLLDANMQLA